MIGNLVTIRNAAATRRRSALLLSAVLAAALLRPLAAQASDTQASATSAAVALSVASEDTGAYPVEILSATFGPAPSGSNALHIAARIGEGFYSHNSDWSLTLGESEFAPSGAGDLVVKGKAAIEFLLPPGENAGSFTLTCSVCSDTTCLLPCEFILSIADEGAAGAVAKTGGRYKYSSSDGFTGPEKFASFLRGESVPVVERPIDAKSGILLFLAFILAGAALNLTPCVLPMIPVQLSILGIGGGRCPKSDGFRRGLAYGLGMAAAYGALGLFVVLSGGVFGALQSSPWFSLAIGILFALLSLSLFDVFSIDFSRFRGSGGSLASAAAVFLLGAVTAVLAGSCVAPAVIAALVLSGTMYASGSVIALAFPLALGIGMGLPWPFIGMGIAVLPRPGKWMKWVKGAMAAAVMGVAVIYFGRAAVSFLGVAHRADTIGAEAGIEVVSAGIDSALEAGNPVLLDFMASWCGSCKAMEENVFTEKSVSELLRGYTLLKIQAEDPTDPKAKEVLDAFNVQGLPAFRIIQAGAGNR